MLQAMYVSDTRTLLAGVIPRPLKNKNHQNDFSAMLRIRTKIHFQSQHFCVGCPVLLRFTEMQKEKNRKIKSKILMRN